MLIPRDNFDLFDDIFTDPFFKRNDNKLMRTDIKEHDDNYVISVDLPGYDKENIKVDITDGYLTVSAKTDSENNEEEKGKYVRRERYFGECSRSFYVGDDISVEDVDASFKNGTLIMEIPKMDSKKELPEKKYIEIKD
jgi:hypothetical protein ELI_4153